MQAFGKISPEINHSILGKSEFIISNILCISCFSHNRNGTSVLHILRQQLITADCRAIPAIASDVIVQPSTKLSSSAGAALRTRERNGSDSE